MTEGILTPILYRDGLFDLMSISYTSLGWHAVISAFFGWYYLHQLLVQRNRKQIIISALAYGTFWGLWSLAFWLPENITNPQFQTPEFLPGQWPVVDFALFALTATLILIAAHWLVSFFWQSEFKPTKTGFIAVTILTLFFYTIQVLIVYPWAPLKLFAALAPTIIFLSKSKPVNDENPYLKKLGRKVRLSDCLLLLAMPLAAISVYGLASVLNPTEGLIIILSAIPGTYGLTLLGCIGWIGSMAAIASKKIAEKRNP